MTIDAKVIEAVYDVVASRKGADPSTSYTAKLFSKGRQKIAQKLGEEAVEAVIAGVADDREELIYESADIFYHLAVLWADVGVKPEEVFTELARRQGISGIDEKNSRTED